MSAPDQDRSAIEDTLGKPLTQWQRALFAAVSKAVEQGRAEFRYTQTRRGGRWMMVEPAPEQNDKPELGFGRGKSKSGRCPMTATVDSPGVGAGDCTEATDNRAASGSPQDTLPEDINRQ